MYLVELSDYTLLPPGTGCGLKDCYFSISKGDVCSIQADSIDDAHLFLKALAMLVAPASGTYHFKGKKVDFKDYRTSLPYKQQIGYATRESAMISNITVRENLLLMRYFFEDSLLLSLDDFSAKLCRRFNIQDKLDLRPTELAQLDFRMAVAIRELAKAPDVLLIERPEDFLGQAKLNLFIDVLKDLIATELALIFISFDKDFVDILSNKQIQITQGKLAMVPM